MWGFGYGRRFHKKAPWMVFNLDDIGVTVTGTMVCPTLTSRCEMHVTELEDVAYPPTVPAEVIPPPLPKSAS